MQNYHLKFNGVWCSVALLQKRKRKTNRMSISLFFVCFLSPVEGYSSAQALPCSTFPGTIRQAFLLTLPSLLLSCFYPSGSISSLNFHNNLSATKIVPHPKTQQHFKCHQFSLHHPFLPEDPGEMPSPLRPWHSQLPSHRNSSLPSEMFTFCCHLTPLSLYREAKQKQ